MTDTMPTRQKNLILDQIKITIGNFLAVQKPVFAVSMDVAGVPVSPLPIATPAVPTAPAVSAAVPQPPQGASEAINAANENDYWRANGCDPETFNGVGRPEHNPQTVEWKALRLLAAHVQRLQA
jgi:hypothetical protein